MPYVRSIENSTRLRFADYDLLSATSAALAKYALLLEVPTDSYA